MKSSMCFVGVLTATFAFFGMADQASAEVKGQTYLVYTDSTVSGEFGSVLNFSTQLGPTGTFTLLAEDLEVGAGAYLQLGGNISFVRATGASTSGYVGSFTAISFGTNLIIGQGSGNAGDTFYFIGI